MLIFGNNVSSTTAGSISDTETTVNLAAGTGAIFPQPVTGQEFIATFIDQATGTQREIVHVTNMNGDTATIVRAQENTTPQAWTAGSIFAHLHTAGAMSAMLQQGQVPPTSIVYDGIDTSTVANQILIPITDPVLPILPTDGMLFLIDVAITNTSGQVFISMVGQPDLPFYYADDTEFAPGYLQTGQKYLITNYQNTSYRLVNIARFLDSEVIHAGTDVGTPNNVSCNTSPPSQSYVQGAIYSIRMANTNTGATTANFDGLGSRSCLRPNAAALSPDDLLANCTALFIVNNGAFIVFGASVGIPGATGPQGPQGPQGPGGPQGPPGADGTMTAYGQPGSVYTVYNDITYAEGEGTEQTLGVAMSDYGGNWDSIGYGSWLTSQQTAAELAFYQRTI